MPESREVLITEIIFHNEQNGYTVAVAETADEQFTIVGTLPDGAKGRTFEITGVWKTHATYGEQFSFTEFREVMPTTAAGIEEFLSSGVLRGIGKKTAAAIIAKFGADTLRVIEEEPEKLTAVNGIGSVKAESIKEAFTAHREFAEIVMHFQKYGIGADYSMKLYKQYGSDAVRIASENPYQLIKDIPGIGFKKADAMALKLGIEPNDEERIKGGTEYTLSYYTSEGHVFLPERELCEKTALLLDVSSEEVADCIVTMAFEGTVKVEKLEGRSVVYLMPYYVAEKNVAAGLAALSGAQLKLVNSDIDSLIEFSESASGIELSEQQKYAVTTSVAYGVSVITGGPGTGKTTIINAIVSVLERGGLKVAISAPTGRAAKRITETSGHFAQTVHRLLEYSFSDDGTRTKFGRNSENPLEYDAVIVDEASMMDILLMNGLISAMRPGMRLIMVGDADQLPSVGAGNVLRDIIASEFIYAVKLTEIFRQAKESLIVVNAHNINRGEYPTFNEKDKDFFFMRRNGENDILKTVKQLCAERLPNYYTDCDPVRDIQILTPVRKGILGCVNINKELQETINPPSPDKAERKFGDRIFREGDKVMQIKNNYEIGWRRIRDFSEGEGIFNGDVGFVESIDSEYGTVTVIFDEDRCVTYDFSNLDELELAYAITVHKSQGSEFPVIVMPISWLPPMLATRNLLYTAVTRGKTAVILVGSEDRMHDMVDNNAISERYSGLAERLRNQTGAL